MLPKDKEKELAWCREMGGWGDGGNWKEYFFATKTVFVKALRYVGADTFQKQEVRYD